MRYLRLLTIGIFSFIAALNIATIRAVAAVLLCSLISICSSAATHFLELNRADAAQAAIPEGQEIAIPPIIREAPINLQNSLADDFIVSRQTPYDSGRNEVLIVSPSTGTEQRFEINLPTGSGFQLYEATFDKVRITDASEIVESANPVAVEAMLGRFSIGFDARNLASEMTLADGSRVEFSESEALVYAADGAEVETIPLSSSSLPSRTSVLALKSSYNQLPANTLAQASSCESRIRNQIYAASQDVGRKANALRGARSLQGRAASWVSAFGKRALEDSMISETRNQTLQEIACVPPIECDEQQDYEGASEIRTDLFKIPGTADQQVDISYEFYDIPDRMEIYYQGELVDSIPRGSGQTSGSSQLSVQLPGGAAFVGVKLIGNEDEGTRWNYTISCIAECETQVATSPQLDESRNSAAEWDYILEELSDYYADNSNNPDAVAFSQQMHNLAQGAYLNRIEAGGWAGDFTRNTLLTAARDIANNRNFWDSPTRLSLVGPAFRNSQFGWYANYQCNRRDLIGLAIQPRKTCAFSRAGDHHLERHLKPAFKQSIEERLSKIADNDCLEGQALIDEFKPTISNLQAEHSKLLNTVLIPGLETLPILPLGRSFGEWNIPRVARDLREDALYEAIQDYVNQGRISREEADTVRTSSTL